MARALTAVAWLDCSSSLCLIAPCAAVAAMCHKCCTNLFKKHTHTHRYTRILAPELRVFDDARVNWRGGSSSIGGVGAWPDVIVESSGSSSSSSGSVKRSPGLAFG